MLFNYHTHSHFCDGSSPLENYVIEAIKQNFSFLGFSGHAPLLAASDFAIKEEMLPAYFNEIQLLKTKYANKLHIFSSLEMDYIPKHSKDFLFFKNRYNLDYTLGAVHLVASEHKDELWFIDGGKIESYDNGLNNIFNGDIKAGVNAYYTQINEMLKTQKPDIVGHLDKIKMNNKNRYFETSENWYKKLVAQTIDLIEKNNTIVEVNTRGIYKKRCDELFPSVEILETLYSRNIPVTISTDAHKPEELSLNFNETLKLLKNIGFKNLAIFNTKWMFTDI